MLIKKLVRTFCSSLGFLVLFWNELACLSRRALIQIIMDEPAEVTRSRCDFYFLNHGYPTSLAIYSETAATCCNLRCSMWAFCLEWKLRIICGGPLLIVLKTYVVPCGLSCYRFKHFPLVFHRDRNCWCTGDSIQHRRNRIQLRRTFSQHFQGENM